MVMLDRPAPSRQPASDLHGQDGHVGRRVLAARIAVAGVELMPSAVAELALRLARAGELALSAHVGRAVDHVHDHVELTSRELPAILSAIGDEPPPGLARLRSALLRSLASSSEGFRDPGATRVTAR